MRLIPVLVCQGSVFHEARRKVDRMKMYEKRRDVMAMIFAILLIGGTSAQAQPGGRCRIPCRNCA